jgi:metal-dependent HD superfamily phosphatase/phosphodiesterase
MGNDQLLPLEKRLSEAASSLSGDFPTPQTDYFKRYQSVKEWLCNHVYKNIGAALSTDGGIYTDHGEDHFDEVIRYAGLMVGAEEQTCIPDRLTPYEAYVLLMAILLHDAGNMFGRTGHEKKAYEQRWLRLVGQCHPFLKWRLAGC